MHTDGRAHEAIRDLRGEQLRVSGAYKDLPIRVGLMSAPEVEVVPAYSNQSKDAGWPWHGGVVIAAKHEDTDTQGNEHGTLRKVDYCRRRWQAA
jgi:hypothetical protein